MNIKDFTWGRHRIVVPEKDCNEPLKTESSSNINQDYRQLLGLYSVYFQKPVSKGTILVRPGPLVQWSIQGRLGQRVSKYIKVWPNPNYWALYEEGTHYNCPNKNEKIPATPFPHKQTKKCFQTDFKAEFRGVLLRTFTGIEAVKEYEVNFIRPVLPEEIVGGKGSDNIQIVTQAGRIRICTSIVH